MGGSMSFIIASILRTKRN